MVKKESFGFCPKGEVFAYTLENANGMEVTILTLGGIVQKLLVPTKDGKTDACLGYADAEGYWNGREFFGALIGRVGNRIAGSEFELNGKTYRIASGGAKNVCHSGPDAMDRKLWDAEAGENSVRLTCVSADGENGFPGTLRAAVTYTLTEDNALRIDYEAVSDADTLINMTNHSYFNLNGGGSMDDATLWVNADAYTAVDGELIPTGELAPVAGTGLDFRTPRTLAENANGAALPRPGVYDNNFCLNGEGLRKVAEVRGGLLTMEVETTTPGVQLYSAPMKTPKQGKQIYEGRCFLCLEAQDYPDAIHHPSFPTTVYRAGEPYRQTTVYRFL